MNLLEEIADFSNLEQAFYQCLQGKRGKLSPQLAFLRLDSYLEGVRSQILSGENYYWGPYKEFYICDPKRRKVSSAPFVDRVTHRAIYNVLHPLLDARLVPTSFACRNGKGNGRAVRCLWEILKSLDEYWVVKLDVYRYFASIHQGRLLGKVLSYLPDDSVSGLIKGLLKNHPQCAGGVGLPLGNLTSQIFANFYLCELDEALYGFLNGRYLRYMDDIVLISPDREQVEQAARNAIGIGRKEKLRFPIRKRIRLGKNAPVPFLGFLVSKDDIYPLNRNRRRVGRKIREKVRADLLPSRIAQACLSYEAWRNYPRGAVLSDAEKRSFEIETV